jgi:type II secretory pathway pseudopilin PulG
LARSRCNALRSEGGFSLLEVVIATAVMVAGVASLAQLFAMSTRTNQNARTTTFASVLAQQKLEQLRGLTWGFDELGLPMTDTATDISVNPESSTGGPGLTPAPSDALNRNTEKYCDFLDSNGAWLAAGVTPPAGTAYIRRWTVEPLPTNPNNTIILQVLVTRWRARGAADDQINVQRLPDEARLISVKTRKAK